MNIHNADEDVKMLWTPFSQSRENHCLIAGFLVITRCVSAYALDGINEKVREKHMLKRLEAAITKKNIQFINTIPALTAHRLL